MRKTIRLFLAVLLLFLILHPVPAQASSVSKSTAQAFKQLNKKYTGAPKGGVALVGSSSLARWKNAEDAFSASGRFTTGQIYNFGIAGSTFAELLDSRYISMVAARKPSIVVVYGANDLQRYVSDNSRNKELVNLTVNTDIRLIETLRSALKKKGVRHPKFLLVSAVKTPSQYKMCGLHTVSCPIWDRIDALNKNLRNYAASVSYADYINIETWLYYKKSGSGQLRFYQEDNLLRKRGKYATVTQLLRGRRTSPWFASDLNHPSRLSYDLVWKKVVRQALRK